jgi:hypothetical protein
MGSMLMVLMNLEILATVLEKIDVWMLKANGMNLFVKMK